MTQNLMHLKTVAFPLFIQAVLIATACQSNAGDHLASPSKVISASLEIGPGGSLRYAVFFNGTQVVEPSELGITINGVNLGRGVVLGPPDISEIDVTYATRGHHGQARDHCKLWRYPVTHTESGRQYTLDLRVYDDGVAFRYIVPGTGTQHVDGEDSSWKLIANSKTWFFERLNKQWKLKSYAGEWMPTDIENLQTVLPMGPIQGTPLVFELPEALGFAAVTKAALYNYSGMRLKAIGDRTLVASFTEGDAGFDVDGTVITPWRVIMLADDLNGLVNSDLISNLNPAPDESLFSDSSYIKPGRCVWSWETLGLGSPETQRHFIDLAAQMEFEYSLVDDGWKDWESPWRTIKSLCDHGKEKNVGVWVWVHSKDILDSANDYALMQSFFDRVIESGAVGVKIDFMNGESKDLIDFEIVALRLAAQRELMINFHGCHASTGESQTWPNEMTREGIRGIEVNKMKEGPLPSTHNAALPFTRFLVGHADYTPVLYTNPGPTTWAHQLATTVAFTSPLQIYAEHPETMMQLPILKDALSVTKTIPSVWDETIVLPGSKIGELSAMARRSGDVWFIGLLNADTPRTFEFDLPFLDNHGYSVTTISDDFDAEPVSLEGLLNQKADLKAFKTVVPFKVDQTRWKGAKRIRVQLAKGGGFVAIIKPENAGIRSR
ncbi:glycoside hydrolase family 97 protein [Neorhodopirellula lusitana]|uniref:glycoside hydrolase family 97 protein n=1 Tax=Neorhodopirellula lusitana TaxID=445327 RepID=UPI00384C602C